MTSASPRLLSPMLSKMAGPALRIDHFAECQGVVTMPRPVEFVRDNPRIQVSIEGKAEDAPLVFGPTFSTASSSCDCWTTTT